MGESLEAKYRRLDALRNNQSKLVGLFAEASVIPFSTRHLDIMFLPDVETMMKHRVSHPEYFDRRTRLLECVIAAQTSWLQSAWAIFPQRMRVSLSDIHDETDRTLLHNWLASQGLTEERSFVTDSDLLSRRIVDKAKKEVQDAVRPVVGAICASMAIRPRIPLMTAIAPDVLLAGILSRVTWTETESNPPVPFHESSWLHTQFTLGGDMAVCLIKRGELSPKGT